MPRVVLIADDNADNILLIRRILRRSGVDCEYLDASSGREAVKLAVERNPDLIFLDMKMPDMDGYEAAAALKSGEATRSIPVIAVTAQAMMGDRERALAAGCDEYLTKPVDPLLLVETFKKYLSKKNPGS
jgi:two-component system, cell cycle response regulator DivK